ncbi:MAG: prepilin-type N-terminal cleavage/methylation domain-containing protein [Smithellaceae bacterium]|nr:prepilin-type N-terminal cleavage/methylation domain-containing protein [Smithellaceae bacterium]
MQRKHFRIKMKDGRGFTLIEIIVSLIVASILGVMLVTFMGSTVVQSANPVLLAQNSAYVYQIVENMGADYKYLMATSATPLTTFKANVGAEGTSQTRYADGSHPYTVVDNHRISFPSGANVTEQADNAGKILKVTIQYRSQLVTALFTE